MLRWLCGQVFGQQCTARMSPAASSLPTFTESQKTISQQSSRTRAAHSIRVQFQWTMTGVESQTAR
jgi:hypothetical protein